MSLSFSGKRLYALCKKKNKKKKIYGGDGLSDDSDAWSATYAQPYETV